LSAEHEKTTGDFLQAHARPSVWLANASGHKLRETKVETERVIYCSRLRVSRQTGKRERMSKDLSINKTPHKSMNPLAIAGTKKCPKSVCTAAQAMELLADLQRGYQGLPPEKRKQVKAFIRELSCTAIGWRGKQGSTP
jgi:hypothetical protein